MERKIKTIGFKVNQNEKFINPITLEMHKNNDKDTLCPSKYYFTHNNILNYIKKKCSNDNSNIDTQKFMLYPYTVLSSVELVKIYNVTDLDQLFVNIKELADSGQKFTTINRVLNSCIKYNFEEYKTKNTFFVDIYMFLLNTFYSNHKINNEQLENFIKKWFNNNNYNNFNLNLGEEIIKNLL